MVSQVTESVCLLSFLGSAGRQREILHHEVLSNSTDALSALLHPSGWQLIQHLPKRLLLLHT